MSNESSVASHEVKSGETLSGIAGKNGITVDALLAANPDVHNPSLIHPGQMILIPTSPDGEAAGSQTETPPVATASDVVAGNSILELFASAGASAKTAHQDGLPGGIASSETMARTDRKRVMAHKEKFKIAAALHALPPALLAAIASRESRGGAVLDHNGFGDHGHGFGIMQVDDRNPFPVAHDGGPAGQPHLNQATQILASKLETVAKSFPHLGDVERLQMAVSRYNGGAGKQPPNSDQGTTGGDYMNDVWARARFYSRTEDWS